MTVHSYDVVALHIASGAQHATCVKMLLDHGAHDVTDLTGNTAGSLARKPQVLQLFSAPIK